LFFEGNEKKVEVVVASTLGSLRERTQSFWSQVVESAGAKILSALKSSSCDAYLLSESSLFVWDDRFTLITCGQTTLVKAVETFLQSCRPEDLRSVIYERKNEYFPQLQKTDFYQDARDLNNYLKGRAWQFGNSDEHHLMLYGYSTEDFTPLNNDFTLEILMYDLQGEAREVFGSSRQALESIRRRTGVDRIFEGFQVDDYLFEPFGYSLNALRGEDYYTIHVTPQDRGTYVSFETNVNLRQNIEPTVKRVLEVFKPRRFDVVVFSPENLSESPVIRSFNIKSQVQKHLNSGYFVSFTHYYCPLQASSDPIEVEI
jgi:S-adenosylmethionine decarboxylase